MSRSQKLAGQRFLIIGGTSKAATTSVFNYLENHPQIRASRAKETRFFLDGDYPLPSHKRCQRDGAAAYLSYFDPRTRPGDEAWNLEATPDYLHCSATPGLIRAALERVEFIFILREPVSRLLSWYQFGQAMNEIPAAMTFEQYVQHQVDHPETFVPGYRHPAFHALQDGRYSLRLGRFIELFGAQAVHVRFHEDLQRDPGEFVQSLCRSIGLDQTEVEMSALGVSNKGVQVRNPLLHRTYHEAKQKLRDCLPDAPRLRGWLRKVGRRVDGVYHKANVTRSEKVALSAATRQFLADYYREETPRLEKLLGVEVPWHADRVAPVN